MTAAIIVGFRTFWSKRRQPNFAYRKSRLLQWFNFRFFDSCSYPGSWSEYRLSDCSTLSCKLNAQTLPSARFTVGLPRMEGVAARAIRDAASCRTLSHYVVLARFWLLPARCRFSQIQYQADARFTSIRLNFASNATLLRF